MNNSVSALPFDVAEEMNSMLSVYSKELLKLQLVYDFLLRSDLVSRDDFLLLFEECLSSFDTLYFDFSHCLKYWESGLCRYSSELNCWVNRLPFDSE